MRIITLEKHSDIWAKNFRREVDSIESIISDNLIAAYHIGSTAIPGLLAKPVIDILIEVQSLSEVDINNNKFKKLGYIAKGEHGIKERRLFQKGGDNRTHHIHVFKTKNPEIERHKLFVEFMNSHPKKINEYEKLKVELVKKYRTEPSKYLEGKSLFIQSIDRDAINWKKQSRKKNCQ